MTQAVRYALFLVCAVQLVLAVAFFLQLPWVVDPWPFPGTTPLTFILIASFFAAVAGSTLWAAASENYGALAGIGLDYVMILAPVAVLMFQLGARSPQFTAFGVACAVWALFGLALVSWSIRIPLDRTLPMPGLVQGAFALFVLVLLAVSTQLIMQVPDVIPWKITPELSVVIGWMFLGAATYFLYGLLRPSWANAAGQLAGFLAYDVVLIVPFLKRFPVVAPEHRIGLIVYTAVVVCSGLLAIYYLFIHQSTRVWAARRPAHGPAAE